MFGFNSKNKQKIIDKNVKSLNKVLEGKTLSTSLDNNIGALKNLFKDNDTFVIRYINNAHNNELRFCIAYFDGVINSTITNDSIIKPLMISKIDVQDPNIINTLQNKVVMINEARLTKDLNEIINFITYGDTILFSEGSNEALILNTKGFQNRAIAEPDSEKNLSGPKEGFTESLMINLSLVRRKVRTNDLKMKFRSIGQRTNTQTCICYIDSLVNKDILKELERRLDKIDIDAILDSNYITELIKDSPYSPFRTTGYTERPDVVAGKLLEGRIAVFVDGSPTIITLPYLFIENFQSSEDYYLSFYYTSFSRILRILGFFLTIGIPAFYIAIVAFHQEMIPTGLLINVASERVSVPLPAAAEAFIMLVTFDILKETGIRMPSNVGQALSIVGALVVGQAAVEAKLVAAPMIIVIAMTGITSLLVPNMNASVIYIRFGLLVLSTLLGLYGFLLGVSATIIHVMGLNSFGVPTTTDSGSLKFQEVKDIAIRAPWWTMIKRYPKLSDDNVRMNVPKNENE